MIQLTIDGKAVEVPAGTTVLQACRLAGITVPTLCDHPALKPYGGCRLCVVEVEGARTLMTSCTLPVYPGMVVRTSTPKVEKAREFVLTLLFSERNHFCMFCQKSAGDCDLQNAAYTQDMTHWPLSPNWKPYSVDASHPYFVMDNNRCILCRRCVRACDELVGNHTLDMENRGAHTMVVADYGLPWGDSSCIRCGTCVQVCPTGALIDRQSAYLGKDTEAEIVTSICQGCSLGCGIETFTHDNQLVRIDGDWAAPVNAGVLCETGRFTHLNDPRERLTTPLVRKNGALQPTTWEQALDTLAAHLLPPQGQNGRGIAALASTRLSAEAMYSFKALFARGLGADQVSSIEEDLVTSVVPAECSLENIKAADCVVVIGADLDKNHQVAGFFIKRNLPKGARLVVIDPHETGLDELAHSVLRPTEGADLQIIQCLMEAIVNLGLADRSLPKVYDPANFPLPQNCQDSGVPPELLVETARLLAMSQNPVFVFGKGLTQQSAEAMEALQALAEMLSGAPLINVRGKANSLAAQWYALDRPFEIQSQQAVYLALGDDFVTLRLAKHLEQAHFLAVQASYASPVTERADVVLPVATWAEQGGHFINLEGRLQAAHPALHPSPAVHSNLEALQSIAQRLGIELDSEWKEALGRHLLAVDPAGNPVECEEI